MSNVVVPFGAKLPYGTQTLQEVLDRLRVRQGQREFLLRQPIMQEGVLMTSRSWTSHQKHKAFMVEKLYPIADKRGATSLLRHVSFDRTLPIKNKPARVNPRGGKIWASLEGLCDFLGKCVTSPVLLDMSATGVYWDYFHPQALSVHPYLDIDICSTPDENLQFHDVFAPVFTTIKLFDELFKTCCDLDEFRHLICYNRRAVGDNKIKFSFHVHWPDIVMASMTDLAQAVLHIASRAPPQPNGTALLDTKPYSSSQQLFRIPYCGKMNDPSAVLLPIQVDLNPSTQIWTYEVPLVSPSDVIKDSSICTLFPSAYSEVRVSQISRPPVSRPQPAADIVSAQQENKRDFAAWNNFWGPVLRKLVVPNFIQFRQDLAVDLNVSCSFPDIDSLVIQNIERLQRYPASFRVSLEGDTFCEYDTGATPHVHGFDDNAISYIVDLHKGRIAQQCSKCRPRVLKWYHFIATDQLTFPIMDDKTARCEGSEFVTVGANANVIPFILTFFSDTILFARDSKQVMVFDDHSGIWKTGSDGNRLLLGKINALNAIHAAYCRARNMHIRDKFVAQFLHMNPNCTQEERDDNSNEQDKLCRKFNSLLKPIWKVPIGTRKDLISQLKPDEHPHQVEAMEPFIHLVPLLEDKCVDLYTWSVRTIQPTDYFVSCLNANLIHLEDDDVTDFVAWQNQVCCGDPEYLQYKLRIMGLSLSMFNFDRSFYMPLGPIGRNGKGSESHLFNVVTMSLTPSRGYYMSREYLTKSGQDRKGANAADTVMTDLANKAIIIADECRDVPLDGPLIKALVSGDRTSGRNLYEAERTNVSNRGKLWIIANKTPKLDYGDPALMDRCRVLPYNARWVRNPAEVIASMTDINQKLWVFQDNPYFKEKTLNSWGNAMVTKCLYELHQFFKSLPRDTENPHRPAKLESIPVPACVKTATKFTIEREHPVIGFLNNFMGHEDSGNVSDYVTVEYAFAQFQRFGKNENSKKLTCMNRVSFQEALEKENIEVMQDQESIYRFKCWKMIKEVPSTDSSGPMAAEGSFYIPLANNKRRRDEDDEYANNKRRRGEDDEYAY
jgi:hypothetical protein